MPRALILGINGQDGAYLARLLVARGVDVSGTTRTASLHRLADLQIVDAVTLYADAEVAEVVSVTGADRVYDLRGPAPWQPDDSRSTAQTRELLAALDGGTARLAVAGAGDDAAFSDEFRASKSAAAQLVADARARGLYAVTARFSEHESRLSGPSTAAQLIGQAKAAARGEPFELAHPERAHDWGWAPEYVDALWRMLEPAVPADARVATGFTMTERDFAAHACEWFGVVPPLPLSPVQPAQGAPATVPGWRAFTYGRDLVRTLCEGAA